MKSIAPSKLQNEPCIGLERDEVSAKASLIKDDLAFQLALLTAVAHGLETTPKCPTIDDLLAAFPKGTDILSLYDKSPNEDPPQSPDALRSALSCVFWVDAAW